ncbi:uncharacterized protein [Arachis hypogaea]|uniref:uncharacterized protein n=1 Tax=Arachis hypogaea TaxID=3818 RepID=UPI000DEC72EC|nr:uncharacterized protein LOC112701332 [Arachis hypogaea]
MGVTSFHHSILKVRLPKHFDKPTNMRYDGTQDPQEHLTTFEARMNLEGVGDAVRCQAFPVTLAGPAIRWFNGLLQGSITTFSDITRAFLAQFTMHIAKAKHPINLLGVTQRTGEPTKKCLDRFNDECLEIDALTDSVASLCLTNGSLNEDFRKHLTMKPVWTTQEIQNVAREYINDEKVSQVVATNKRQPVNPIPQQHGHPQAEKSREPPRTVYQHITDKGILSKPQQLKDRTGGNKSLYCDYHKDFGHKNQDCFDLKDVLKQAFREDKLAEFSQFIREPRRRECERSEEDQSRAVKPREGLNEESEQPLAVVNVVIGRNALPSQYL